MAALATWRSIRRPARLVERAGDWPRSSVGAHLAGRNDGLVRVRPLLDRAPRFADLLDADDPAFAALRRSELTAARSTTPRSRSPMHYCAPPQSGGIKARTGLRMMPTFP
jgi:hypothetical protein